MERKILNQITFYLLLTTDFFQLRQEGILKFCSEFAKNEKSESAMSQRFLLPMKDNLAALSRIFRDLT